MHRQTKTFIQISGAAGLGFAILIVLANVIALPAGAPMPGTAFAEAAKFFAGESPVLAVASAVSSLAWMLATVFGAGAVVALWPSSPGWSLVGFGGMLMQCGTFAAIIALRIALMSAPPSEGLWALHEALFLLNGTFLAIVLVGLSIAGLQSGLIRRWHAALGFVSAVLMFASSTLSVNLLGLLGWLMWVVWIGTYGVTLIRLPSKENRS